MREFYFLFLLFVTACKVETEPVQAVSSDWRISPVQFQIVAADGSQKTVRLAEVRFDGPDDFRDQARSRLEALIDAAQGQLTLESPGAELDRYERHLAHVYDLTGSEPVWFQGVLVSEGWLVAASYADNHARARELQALEDLARQASRGGWGEGIYQILQADPNMLAQKLDSVQIIQGRVMDVSPVLSGQIYLNFGFDWRTDFTVSIPEEALERFTQAGLVPSDLEDRVIRVRGWLYEDNGPMIRIDHPEAIELIGPDASPTLP